MASVNKVILVGNLGADPEMRYMSSGDAVCNIRLATTDSWKDKNSGEKREVTEWHRVVFYRKLAEIAGQYLKKGSQVYIEGRLKTRKWQDKDGQDRYTTEIEATEMQMLGGRGKGRVVVMAVAVATIMATVVTTMAMASSPSATSRISAAAAGSGQSPREGIVVVVSLRRGAAMAPRQLWRRRWIWPNGR